MRGDTGSAAVVSERMSCRGWAEGPAARAIISATEQHGSPLEQPPSLWVSRP